MQLEEVTAITERIQALDQKHDEWRSQIAGLQREVESKQKELAALPPAPDHGSAIEKLGKEVAALSQKVRLGLGWALPQCLTSISPVCWGQAGRHLTAA